MDITNFINEYSLNNIKKKYNLIVKNDKNNYYMINYVEKQILPDDIISYFSGTILEKNTNKVLYYFNGKKLITNIIDHVKKYISANDFYIKNLYIGPMIKLFNYKNKWMVSTSYHTDAKKKYIKKDNKKTLYTLFKDIITEKGCCMSFFWNNLNQNYCYTFIINHKEIGNSSNNLIFLSKYDLINKKEYDNYLIKQKINYKFNIIIPPSYKITDYDIFNNLHQKQKYILIEKKRNHKNILNKLEINI
jgi:hypothetical protein